MPILITPREPNAFDNLFGESVTIKSVGNRLTDPSSQLLALRDLGIRVNGNILTVSFKEAGFAYAEPNGDRRKLEPHKSTKNFTVNVSLQLEPLYPFSIVVSFEPFVEECVNFFGSVTVHTPSMDKRFIPLTGRGTAALEGRLDDAHAGYVTGGACASFQNRCAFVMAVAAAAGAGVSALSQIGQQMFSIDDRYHGRYEILDYTVYCAQTNFRDRISYAEFMRQSYPNEKDWTPLLKSVSEKKGLPQCFYNSVLLKLSPSEFQEDRERALSCNNSRTIKRLFSVEDAMKMLVSKQKLSLLDAPDQWNFPQNQGFYVQARCGDDFVSSAAKMSSLKDVLSLLNSGVPEEQGKALGELGLELAENELKILFHEKASSNSSSDADSFKTATLCLSFNHDLQLPLDVKSKTNNAFIADGVNFFGSLTVAGKYFVPLPGRGTLSLEPISALDISFSGPVYSGKCASFITRCAIVLAVVRSLGGTDSQLGQVKEMLCGLDFALYNKSDIICYFAECLKHPQVDLPSYTSFISFIYDQKSWSSSLNHLLKHGYPESSYFASVTQHLTAEEFAEDKNTPDSNHNERRPKRRGNNIAAENEVDPLEFGFNFFPYRARLGNDFYLSDSTCVKMADAFEQLASSTSLEKQAAIFDVKLGGRTFDLTVVEKGSPYADQNGDRSATVSNTEVVLNLKVPCEMSSSGPNALLNVSIKPVLEHHVNYAGILSVKNPVGEIRMVPLVGRGTIALEGKEQGDTHAGLATGPGCATFQNRAAVILALGYAAGLDESSMRQVYYLLSYINSCYHGRSKSLDYVMYCFSVSAKKRRTYFEYIKENVDQEERNCLMRSLVHKDKVCEATLAKVKSKLSPEEQEEDLDALDIGSHDHAENQDHTESLSSRLKKLTGGQNVRIMRPGVEGVANGRPGTGDEEKHVHFNLEAVDVIDPLNSTVQLDREHAKDFAPKSSLSPEPESKSSSDAESLKSKLTFSSSYSSAERQRKDFYAGKPDTSNGYVDETNLAQKNETLLETISKHLNPDSIKVRPRMGTPFKNFVGQQFSMYDVVVSFRRNQSEGLSMLGINIDRLSKSFNVIFREDGTPYAEPSGNRGKLAPEKVTEVSYSVRLANMPPEELDVNVSLVPFENDGVNYLGRITFHSALKEYRYIPLVGRGTIALEGKDSRDAHCTLCTTGYSATFQQRIAFCFAALAAAGGTLQDLDDLSVALKPVNDLYHGRDELFYYTLQCSKNAASSVPSYFKFMSHLFPVAGNRPPNLTSLSLINQPDKGYYAQLIDEMSREEIRQDQLAAKPKP